MLSFRYSNFEIPTWCRVDRTRLYVFEKTSPSLQFHSFLNLLIWSRFYDSIKKVVWPEKAYSSRQYPSEPDNVNYNNFIWILFTITVNMCLDRIHSPENFWINNFHKTRELITHCAGDVQTYSGQFSVRDSRRWKFLLWTAVRQLIEQLCGIVYAHPFKATILTPIRISMIRSQLWKHFLNCSHTKMPNVTLRVIHTT